MEKRRVLMDWGYMAYLETGKGNPVVFIHGAGNRGEVWSKLFITLQNYYRIIAVDLPGHGDSSCIQINSVDAYTGEILNFLEKMDLEKVTLVGHSMGGAITIKATPASERVEKAVLVGTGSELRVNPKLLNGLKEDFLNWAGTMAKWSFVKGCSDELINSAREMMIEAGRETLYNDMYACSKYSGEESLKNFYKPALIVCGEKDVMTPPDLSRQLTEAISNSVLKFIAEAGHMVHQEQPEILAEAILSFLG